MGAALLELPDRRGWRPQQPGQHLASGASPRRAGPARCFDPSGNALRSAEVSSAIASTRAWQQARRSDRGPAGSSRPAPPPISRDSGAPRFNCSQIAPSHTRDCEAFNIDPPPRRTNPDRPTTPASTQRHSKALECADPPRRLARQLRDGYAKFDESNDQADDPAKTRWYLTSGCAVNMKIWENKSLEHHGCGARQLAIAADVVLNG